MDKQRISSFFHGLPAVHEEISDQDSDSSVADEQRRQHILESMAKLEGHSKPILDSPYINTGTAQEAIKNLNNPNFFNINPNSHQFQPPAIPHQLGFLPHQHQMAHPAIPTTTLHSVPCFYYPHMIPIGMTQPRTHSSVFPITHPINVTSLSTQGYHHLMAPNSNQGTRIRLAESGKARKTSLPAAVGRTNYSGPNESMKTPEKPRRSQPLIGASPESSPDSSLRTPPLAASRVLNQNTPDQLYDLKNQSLKNSQNYDYYCEHRSSSLIQSAKPQSAQRPPSGENPSSSREIKNKYQHLIKSNNYALQLESRQTGIKLIEKKRLTPDELRLLQTLPPSPPRVGIPRPSFSSASTNSSTKKKKKDRFSWFDY